MLILMVDSRKYLMKQKICWSQMNLAFIFMIHFIVIEG